MKLILENAEVVPTYNIDTCNGQISRVVWMFQQSRDSGQCGLVDGIAKLSDWDSVVGGGRGMDNHKWMVCNS